MAVKGQEVLGLALVTAVQAAAATQPGHRALDRPAMPAQSCGGFDASAGDAVSDAARAEPSAQVVVVVSLVRVELGGPSPAWAAAGPDRRNAAYQRLKRLAVVEVRAGDPDRDRQTGPLSDRMDLRAFLAPVHRIRTCQLPPFRARMFTESIAQRDQSSAPREPSSSRMMRCSLAQTRAVLHSVKRRCAVGPDGPKAGGNCRQVQPVVATKMITANTSRSPYRRRPPPCGRAGAGGTTRWKSSHNSSGTKRSTITTQRRLLNPPNETTPNLTPATSLACPWLRRSAIVVTGAGLLSPRPRAYASLRAARRAGLLQDRIDA